MLSDITSFVRTYVRGMMLFFLREDAFSKMKPTLSSLESNGDTVAEAKDFLEILKEGNDDIAVLFRWYCQTLSCYFLTSYYTMINVTLSGSGQGLCCNGKKRTQL